jgi:hypothetical protein
MPPLRGMRIAPPPPPPTARSTRQAQGVCKKLPVNNSFLESKEEEAEGGEHEKEELMTGRNQPVPKWEVRLAENRAVWQLCKQLRLAGGW